MALRRRTRPGALATTAAALCGLCGCSRAPAPLVFPRAPILLVSIDTLRSDHLPAYGYTKVATPALDRFRRDAILFESAWSPCPMTLPSHVTMLTGLLPPEHGVRNNVGFTFDATAHPHLPGLLKAAGYATGAAVSSYVLRGETGLSALFDTYEDSLDPRRGTGFSDQQRPGSVTAGIAKAWIDAHHGQPFFYFFHIYEPHVPWEPPEPFRTRYGVSYDAEVAAADAVVGDLLDHLRALSLYDRALVVVTSDHGEGLGDHGEDQHSILLYREALQVPLLVKLPGAARAGESVREPVQLADLAVTLASAAGLAPPKTLTARSLLERGPARALYAETLYPRLQLGWSDLRSVVDGRWHYIHGPRPELYDLASDPAEAHDLAAQHPREVERLQAALGRVPSGPAIPAGVDTATAERLAALGYVGTPRGQRLQAGALPNPREMLPQLERMKLGFRLAGERRYEEAVAVLDSVTREQPANVEAWVRLGEALMELGRPADAAAAFQASLDRGGMELVDVVVELGYARLRQGQLDAALRAAERVVGSVPAKAHELKARVALARRRFDEAQSEADAAAAGRNPQPASRLVGAEVRIARGDLGGALALLDDAERQARAARVDGVRNLDALRGDALARSGRLREAEEAYRREAAAFPGNLVAQANLAALLFAEGRRGDAAAVLRAMVTANPGARARQVAAVTLRAAGERAGSRRP